MRGFLKKIVVVCMGLLFAHTLVAKEDVGLREHFLKKIDEVVSIVENKNLSKDDRNSNIIKVLTPMFDFELMAKLSLGSRYKELSSKDQDRFVALYVERMKQSYSSKIDAYKDEKVEIKKVENSKEDRIAFVTDLVSKDQKLEIVYRFHKPKEKKEGKDSWLIYDVEILGVSILKTDIAQFREFLQTKSINELMENLSKKS